MISPEELKRIAEYMGLPVAKTFDFKPKENAVYIGDCTATYLGSSCTEYNPLTNPEQLLEIIIKARVALHPVKHDRNNGESWDAVIYYGDGEMVMVNDKELPEAVIKAVLERIGGE